MLKAAIFVYRENSNLESGNHHVEIQAPIISFSEE